MLLYHNVLVITSTPHLCKPDYWRNRGYRLQSLSEFPSLTIITTSRSLFIKLKILCICCRVTVSTMSNTTELSAREEEAWTKFKGEFKRNYASPEEEQHRKSIFIKNLHKIEEHNKLYEAGQVTWNMGINDFADKHKEEICCHGKKTCEKK